MMPLFLPTKALFSIAIYWLIVSLAHLTRYSARLQQREQQQAILQAEVNEACLESLQMQLQPHFLFNTLNTISALIPEQPRMADEMIGNLCDLLRLTLDQKDQPESSLREELHLLGCYLQIQLVRFNGRLRINQQVEPEILDALVPRSFCSHWWRTR
jgi:LytS/YehU family sensor histidine kinase